MKWDVSAIMDMTYEDFLRTYKDIIDGVWEPARIVCILDSPEDFGYFAKSDIFIAFDPNGVITIFSERIKRNVRNWLKAAILSKTHSDHDGQGYDTSVQVSKYIDITTYRCAWYEWVKNYNKRVTL